MTKKRVAGGTVMSCPTSYTAEEGIALSAVAEGLEQLERELRTTQAGWPHGFNPDQWSQVEAWLKRAREALDARDVTACADEARSASMIVRGLGDEARRFERGRGSS